MSSSERPDMARDYERRCAKCRHDLWQNELVGDCAVLLRDVYHHEVVLGCPHFAAKDGPDVR